MKLAFFALLATAAEAVKLRPKTWKIPTFAQAFNTMKTRSTTMQDPTDEEMFNAFD